MAIKIENLSKIYPAKGHSIQALSKINLSVPKGSIFGILGPNGAGKTTLLKIITGITKPSNKDYLLTVMGEDDLILVKKEIGFLPETPQFFKNIKAFELLKFTMEIGGKIPDSDHIDDMLKYVSLYKQKNLKIRNFSKGMLQRIGFAQAVINSPQLIVLDEPFSSVDPVGRKKFINYIREFQEKGHTIILSSHNLKDIEEVCSDIVILRQGRVVLNRNMVELTGDCGYTLLVETREKVRKEVKVDNKKALWGALDELRILDSFIIRIDTDVSHKIEEYYNEKD